MSPESAGSGLIYMHSIETWVIASSLCAANKSPRPQSQNQGCNTCLWTLGRDAQQGSSVVGLADVERRDGTRQSDKPTRTHLDRNHQLWANGQFLMPQGITMHPTTLLPLNPFLALEALALPSSVAPGALFFLISCASFSNCYALFSFTRCS